MSTQPTQLLQLIFTSIFGVHHPVSFHCLALFMHTSCLKIKSGHFFHYFLPVYIQSSHTLQKMELPSIILLHTTHYTGKIANFLKTVLIIYFSALRSLDSLSLLHTWNFISFNLPACLFYHSIRLIWCWKITQRVLINKHSVALFKVSWIKRIITRVMLTKFFYNCEFQSRSKTKYYAYRQGMYCLSLIFIFISTCYIFIYLFFHKCTVQSNSHFKCFDLYEHNESYGIFSYLF